MKITKELLRRHSVGLCSEEEKKAVEEWFKTKDDSFIDLSMVSDEELEEGEEKTWFRLSQSIPELTGNGSTQAIPLRQKVTRYAAAACVIIGIFAAGFSTGFTFAKPSDDIEPEDLLYLYGAQGAEPQLRGEEFSIKLDGQLALYNGSLSPKRIRCGEQQFVLEPRQKYYLYGSDGDAALLNEEQFSERNTNEFSPEGGFSIIRTDD